MDKTMLSAIIWIIAGVILILYLARRRKRKILR